MDLIRQMLFAIEAAPTGFAPHPLKIDGYTEDQVGYHAYLLINGDYAKGPVVTGSNSTSPEAIILNLTWKGHEFADAARSETTWRKAKDMIQAKVGSIGLDAVKDLLIRLGRRELGLDE
jgi:hypothetical protein